MLDQNVWTSRTYSCPRPSNAHVPSQGLKGMAERVNWMDRAEGEVDNSVTRGKHRSLKTARLALRDHGETTL